MSEPRAERAAHGPVLILSISNGAGHTRAAEAIASAIRAAQPQTEVGVVDVLVPAGGCEESPAVEGGAVAADFLGHLLGDEGVGVEGVGGGWAAIAAER